MPTFTDDKGRDWRVRVDVTTIRNVREIKTEDGEIIDLGSLARVADTFIKFADDPCLLCNVLFVICEDQTKERDVSDEDFGRLLAGDVIANAATALEEAVTDFFPQQKRSLLQRLRKKVDQVKSAGIKLVSEKLDSPELEAKILAKMQRTMDAAINESLMPLNSATNSPESSE